MTPDRLSPHPLDTLLADALVNLDHSNGLPSNFTHLTTQAAAEHHASTIVRRRRREQRLAIIIPIITALITLITLLIALPDLPSAIIYNISTIPNDASSHIHTDISLSALSLWLPITTLIALLITLDSLLRRRLARHRHQ